MIKLLGRKVGFLTLRDRLPALWKVQGGFELLDVSNGYFMVKFDLEADRDRVMHGFDTKYYYEVGIGNNTRQFWFETPPPVGPDVPYTFGVIGDLGQTYNSDTTLTHYEKNPAEGKTVLYVGDLSYADDYPFHDNTKWDTWGRFTERIVGPTHAQ
uniref:Purple acid phosphatase 2 n=1 Tax=Cajanus cajan TaxID=3821 RepID=A0A151TC38_CAJCA|nr:Purple acid phosphatase 2 [Cajanus cajan]